MKLLTKAIAAGATLTIAMALGACASPAPTAPTTESDADTGAPIAVTYATPIAGALPFLPLEVALAKGYLEDHGIELTSVQLSPQAIPAALAGGQVDMSADVVYNIARYLESGVGVQLVSGLNENVDFVLVRNVTADLPDPGAGDDGWMDSFRALEGHTIGVPAKAGPVGLTLTALMSLAGVEEGSYTVIDTPGAATANALAANQVVAVVSGGGYDLPLNEKGLGETIVNFSEDIPEIFDSQSSAAVFATDSFLSANPEAAARIQLAIADAVAFIQDEANIDEVVSIALAASTPDSEGLQDKILTYTFNSTLSVDGVTSALDWAEQAGITTKSIDAQTTIAKGVESY